MLGAVNLGPYEHIAFVFLSHEMYLSSKVKANERHVLMDFIMMIIQSLK